MVSRVLGLLVVLTLLTAVPGAPAEPAPLEACESPCPWVYPQIVLEVALTPEMLRASNLDELPAVVDVHVGYRWDLETDGTGVPGPGPSEIHLSLPKVPYWLDAGLSAYSCPFQPLPHQPDQEVCTVQLRLEPHGIPQTAAALDAGDRLLLVGMSDETGTFKRGYGVEDIRFVWDGEGDSVAAGEVQHQGAGLAPLLLPAAGVAALAGATLVGVLVRRRLRRPF